MRRCALCLLFLAAGLGAQEPQPAPLPEKPGGLDMASAAAVRERLDAVRKERAAREQEENATAAVSVLSRQIELLESHLAFLDERAQRTRTKAQADAELATAQAERDAAERALKELDAAARVAALRDLPSAQQVQEAVARDYAEPLRRLQEEAVQAQQAARDAAAALARMPEDIAAAETRLQGALKEVGDLQAATADREKLTDAEYVLLRRRQEIQQQTAVHARMRAAFLKDRKPVAEVQARTAEVRAQQAELKAQRAKALHDAAQRVLEERLAAEKRASEDAIRRKQRELEQAKTEFERLRLEAELENEHLRAAVRQHAAEAAEHARRRTELEAELQDATAELARFEGMYGGAAGAPAPPPASEVARTIRRLEEDVDQARLNRKLDMLAEREATLADELARTEDRIAGLQPAIAAKMQAAEAALRAAGGADMAWRTERAAWMRIEAERERLLEENRAALDGLREHLKTRGDLRREIYETRRRTLLLVRRENLFLRGESRITWEAVKEGFGDLVRLPAWIAGAARAVGGYLTDPASRGGVLPWGGSLLLSVLVLLLAGRFLRARLARLAASGKEDRARTARRVARLLRTIVVAVLLFLVPYSATVLLAGLPAGVDGLLAEIAWIAGGFWLLRGLNRLLLGKEAWLPVDPAAAARLKRGLDVLLWVSLFFLPLQHALTHLGYGNAGAIELLELVYKVLFGLLLLTLVLRRGLLLALLPPGRGRVGRVLRFAVLVLQPAAALLVPVLLLLEAFRYDILAGLITAVATVSVTAIAAGYLLYRVALWLLEHRLPALMEKGDDEAARTRHDTALTSARFGLRVFFLLASAWAVFALSGASLAEVREFFSVPLPFQAPGAEDKVTWWNVFAAILLLVFFLAGTRHVKQVLQHLLLARTSLDRGLQYTITTLVGYVLVATGVYVAVKEVLDLSNLGYIVAALSVGLGFGLQEIVSNFVSGLTLLFERPLKVGDLVQVADTEGVVTRINIRSTTVQTRDNIYILVPNRAFITGNVVNYVYTDPKIRIRLPFGVSYSSDPAMVREVALEVAKKHGRILARPSPDVWFRAFGESSLDFELLAWIDEPIDRHRISSDLYFALFAALKRAGIEIPFPQRDLHLRSAEALRIVPEERPEPEEDADDDGDEPRLPG